MIDLNVNEIYNTLMQNLPYVFGAVGVVWIIHFINIACEYRLNHLGLIPRHFVGLRGILFSPFLHSSFSHLLFNSVMFIPLSILMITSGLEIFIIATVMIILLSGILTWVLGRKAIHIGSSSLVMGYLGYSVVNAYFNPSALSILVAVVCVLQLSQLFTNLLPAGEKTSWEGHLFGFISGIFVSFSLPYVLVFINQLTENIKW